MKGKIWGLVCVALGGCSGEFEALGSGGLDAAFEEADGGGDAQPEATPSEDARTVDWFDADAGVDSTAPDAEVGAEASAEAAVEDVKTEPPVAPGEMGGACELAPDCSTGFCRWGVCTLGGCVEAAECGLGASCISTASGRICLRTCEADADCIGDDRCKPVGSLQVCLDPRDFQSASL